ncbi:hypothetical protein B296_00014292 [Ensete ventricosum]|uniref:Uncharacterized protein n=1 Tax=Ensete ventricosum TaxID=4639 RepID=A0A426XJZ8_ENSVE|nr:hypothetical protein B296_00014292 [Ensete ventricosum]
MVPQRWVFRVYALKLASDESLSRQDMRLSTTEGVVRLQPSNIAFSTTKRMGEVKYPISLTYLAEELCISSANLVEAALASGRSRGDGAAVEVSTADEGGEEDHAEGVRLLQERRKGRG